MGVAAQTLPPIGAGVTWTQLLLMLAASTATLLLFWSVCWALDASHRAAIAHTTRRSLSRWVARPAPPRHTMCHAYRSDPRIMRFAALGSLWAALGQYVLYLVGTYAGAPSSAGAGIIIVSVLLALWFIGRQWIALAAVAPDSRLRASLSLEQVCETLATVSLILPWVVGTWLTLSPLRLVAALTAFTRSERGKDKRDTVPRLLAILCLRFIVFICLLTSLVATLERVGDPPGWGVVSQGDWAMTSALYWGVVTSTTVGYGDVVPITVLGRAATSACILLALLFVAIATRELLDLVSQDRAGLGRASVPPSRALVLLAGECSTQQLRDTITELLTLEQGLGERFLHVVALLDGASFDSTAFGCGLFSQLPVTLLKGTVASVHDLERALAFSPQLQAVFILQRHDARSDERNILRCLSIRIRLPHVPLFAALARHELRHHVVSAGVSEDALMSLDVLRGGLLAQATQCRGSATLLLNLLAAQRKKPLPPSPPPPPPPPQLLPTQPRLAQSPPPPTDPLSPTVLGFASALIGRIPPPLTTAVPVPWMDEYELGLEQCVHELRVPPWLVNRSHAEAVLLVFIAAALVAAHTNSASLVQLLHSPPAALAAGPTQPQLLALLENIAVQLPLHEGALLMGVKSRDPSSGRACISIDPRGNTLLRRDDTLFIVASSLASLAHEGMACFRTLLSGSDTPSAQEAPGEYAEEDTASSMAPPPVPLPPLSAMRAEPSLQCVTEHTVIFWQRQSLEQLHLIVVPLRLASLTPIVVVCVAPADDFAAALADTSARLERLQRSAHSLMPLSVWQVRSLQPLASLADLGTARLKFARHAVVVCGGEDDDSYIDAPAVLLTRLLEARCPHLLCVTELLNDKSAVLLGPCLRCAPHPAELQLHMRPRAVPFSVPSTTNVLLTRSLSHRGAGLAPMLEAFGLASPIDEEDAASPLPPRAPVFRSHLASTGTVAETDAGSVLVGDAAAGGAALSSVSREEEWQRTRALAARASALESESAGHHLRLDVRFASGALLPLSALNAALVSSFYHPSALRLLTQLARGDDLRIFSAPVPASMHGASWGRTFVQWLVEKRDGVPLALYRSSNESAYVATNPHASTPLRNGDVLLCISSGQRGAGST